MAKQQGRPSKYSQQVADLICGLIATSNKGIHAICKKNKKLPSATTIVNWLADERYSSFLAQYTRAREDQADFLAEDMMAIADRGGKDSITKVNRDKLRIDTRKFIASKLKPKKYGDKLDVTTDGEKIQANIAWLGGKK